MDSLGRFRSPEPLPPVAGPWQVAWQITGASPLTGPFQRRLVSSTQVRPGPVDLDASQAEVRAAGSSASGQTWQLVLVPQDAYGNPLGPGWPQLVQLATPEGDRSAQVVDHGDGAYTATFRLPNDQRQVVLTVAEDLAYRGDIRDLPQLPAYTLLLAVEAGPSLGSPGGAVGGLAARAGLLPWLTGELGGRAQLLPGRTLGALHLRARVGPQHPRTRPWLAAGPRLLLDGRPTAGLSAGLGLEQRLGGPWVWDLGAAWEQPFTAGGGDGQAVLHAGLGLVLF